MLQNRQKTTNNYPEQADVYSEHLLSEGASKNDLKNVRSAIGIWRDSLGLQNQPIGKELEELFNESVKKYVANETKRGIKPSTSSSRVSRIKKFRSFFLEQKKTHDLPEKFCNRLKFFLELSGIPTANFVKDELGEEVTARTLLFWMKGISVPNHKNYYVIEKIEQRLNLTPKTLTSLLPNSYKNQPQGEKTIEYRKRLTIQGKTKISVWTAGLEEEFEKLVEYKTATLPPDNLKRNSIWTRNQNGELSSAKITKRFLASFAGFCCLDKNNSDPQLRGFGLGEDSLSIALLTNKNIVSQYVTVFRKSRSNNKYNKYHISFLSLATSLLRKKTGYLYQKPEFAEKLNMNLTTKEWRTRCIKTRKKLLKIKKAIEAMKRNGGDEYGFGRDPEEPIKEILKLKKPLSATMKMLSDMLLDVEKIYNRPQQQACLYRDALLIAMLQANPLRSDMFRTMKIGENLVKKPDGSWWLEFKKNCFKNRFFLKEDYSVQLSLNIWAMIETYLNKFRPRLLKDNLSDHVFISSHVTLNENNEPSMFMNIWRVVSNRTKKYIPDCPGFGPHSVRHLVASSLVKSSPIIGIQLAAKALNDNVKTVEESYTHLLVSEKFEPYNVFFAENWAEAGLGEK